MKSSEVIKLTAPLREVRLMAISLPATPEQRQREAEQAAYERGRRDGEKALSEQLLHQRTLIVR